MHLIADENFPGPVLPLLRARGHDVVSIKEDAPGADDRVVLELAQRTARVLVTFDKDSGELAFAFGLPATCGIVLFRLSGSHPEVDNQRVITALESGPEWAGHFAVVTADRMGKLADPFGHEWALATHTEDVSPEEMARRAKAMGGE